MRSESYAGAQATRPGDSGRGPDRLRLCLAAALVLGLAGLPADSRAEPGPDHTATVSAEALVRIELVLGSGRLIRVGQPVASVFIGDPEVVGITPVSDRAFYALGKGIGSTEFFALNEADDVVARNRIAVVPDTAAVSDALARLGSDAVKVSRAGSKAITKGRIDDLGDALAAGAAVDAGGLERIDALLYEGPRQVSLRVRFAEVSRVDLRKLGISWDLLSRNSSFAFGLLTGQPGLVASGLPETFASLSGAGSVGAVDVSVLIDALQRDGLVQILAEPTLTTVSGQPAEFLAGGEFPVPVPLGDDNVGIEYKRFGVSIAFTPTILPRNRIAIDVEPEVSFLSETAGVQIAKVSIPGLSVRRARTTVELASGQSFAIAGLFQRDVSKNVDSLPFVANLPILGELFKSQRFQRQETELVILITPYLMAPAPGPRSASAAAPPSPRALIGFIAE